MERVYCVYVDDTFCNTQKFCSETHRKVHRSTQNHFLSWFNNVSLFVCPYRLCNQTTVPILNIIWQKCFSWTEAIGIGQNRSIISSMPLTNVFPEFSFKRMMVYLLVFQQNLLHRNIDDIQYEIWVITWTDRQTEID